MELVMGGLTALAILIFILWAMSLSQSVARDRRAAAEQKQAAQEAAEQQKREARLYEKGVKLRCLGCEKTFRGPLTEQGCPDCRLATLVVTEADYKQTLNQKGT